LRQRSKASSNFDDVALTRDSTQSNNSRQGVRVNDKILSEFSLWFESSLFKEGD